MITTISKADKNKFIVDASKPYGFVLEQLTEKKLEPVFIENVENLVNHIAGFGKSHFTLKEKDGDEIFLFTFPDTIEPSRTNLSPYRIEVESFESDTDFHYTYTYEAKIETKMIANSWYREFALLKDSIVFDKHEDGIAVVRVGTVFLLFIHLSHLNTSPPYTDLYGLIARAGNEEAWSVLKEKKIYVYEKMGWGEEKKIKELTWKDFDNGPIKLN